jgi:YD repeat-containing protein
MTLNYNPKYEIFKLQLIRIFHLLRTWLYLLLLCSLSATAQPYDARGNTASETRPSAVRVATSYDGHGHLLSYTRTGDASQANVYNGLDDRVTVASGTTIRRFVYDPGGRVLGEYGTSATDVIAERIWMTPQVTDAGIFGGDDGTGGYAPIAIVTGTTCTATIRVCLIGNTDHTFQLPMISASSYTTP